MVLTCLRRSVLGGPACEGRSLEGLHLGRRGTSVRGSLRAGAFIGLGSSEAGVPGQGELF